jgi:hypothetical protein
MRHAKFDLVGVTPTFVIIRDVGPWSEHPTITNDVEYVVRLIAPLLDGRRLLYFDSLDELDELILEDEKFTGFAPYAERH